MKLPPDPATRRYTWALVALTTLGYVGLLVWPDFMAAMGAGHGGVWFLDINTLLASNDAVTRGLNPYLPNPLDYLRDSHAYSDWWLQLRHLGLGRKDRLWLGAVIDGLFFLAVFWQLRARTFGEMLVLWLYLWSPPIILGFNRANPDLLIFALLTPLVPAWLGADKVRGLIATALLVLAIGLKYYPAVAVLLVLLTARTPRELRFQLALWAGLGLALALNLFDDLQHATGLMTATAGYYTFGAAALAANLGHEPAVWLGGMTLALAAFAVGWWQPVFQAAGREAEAQRAGFALGAGLVTCCFFFTISYTYRLVFALMALPWLLALARGPQRREKIYALLVLALGGGLFWADGLAVLVINLSLGVLSDSTLRLVHDGFIVAIHVLGWLWVLLLLAGLGTIAGSVWTHWSRRAVPGADRGRQMT